MLTFILLFGSFAFDASAATKKKKTTKSASAKYVSKKLKKKKGKKNKSRTASRSRRSYKRSGTGPDLRALTTESPEAPYTEGPDNGVNSVETKPGL